jgi:hypothetical protein
MADGSRTLPRQARNSGAACGGRPIRVPRSCNSVRTVIRRHLAEEGLRMQDLAGPWQCKRTTVYGMFCDNRPFSPPHIDAVIEFLRLDEFDAAELRLLGAREAGWNLDTKYLLTEEEG